ncbi:uncharacterized protein LOC143330424 isoform X2 [Chaetodon auriga]|uniref:uncharacterized protein LOC143330424 isoform X2 n=1 Tax=Chaetodon auriga TaxID=39042 RepID=UPI004032BABE
MQLKTMSLSLPIGQRHNVQPLMTRRKLRSRKKQLIEQRCRRGESRGVVRSRRRGGRSQMSGPREQKYRWGAGKRKAEARRMNRFQESSQTPETLMQSARSGTEGSHVPLLWTLILQNSPAPLLDHSRQDGAGLRAHQ